MDYTKLPIQARIYFSLKSNDLSAYARTTRKGLLGTIAYQLDQRLPELVCYLSSHLWSERPILKSFISLINYEM